MDNMNLFPNEKTNISFRIENYVLEEVDKLAKEYNQSRNMLLNNLLKIAVASVHLKKGENENAN